MEEGGWGGGWEGRGGVKRGEGRELEVPQGMCIEDKQPKQLSLFGALLNKITIAYNVPLHQLHHLR